MLGGCLQIWICKCRGLKGCRTGSDIAGGSNISRSIRQNIDQMYGTRIYGGANWEVANCGSSLKVPRAITVRASIRKTNAWLPYNYVASLWLPSRDTGSWDNNLSDWGIWFSMPPRGISLTTWQWSTLVDRTPNGEREFVISGFGNTATIKQDKFKEWWSWCMQWKIL